MKREEKREERREEIQLVKETYDWKISFAWPWDMVEGSGAGYRDDACVYLDAFPFTSIPIPECLERFFPI